MNKIKAAIAGALTLLSVLPVAAQQLPINLPANSVIGRTSIGPTSIGPGEATAIPFAELAAALGQFQAGMTVGGTTISGGPGILFNASNGGTLQATTSVPSAVLVTSGAGAPSLSTTLPNGIHLGAALATSINGLSINSTTGTLTVANGKTLTDTSGVTINTILLPNGSGGFSQYAGSSCTNQVAIALSTIGALTCGNITNSFLTPGTFSSITGVGALTAGTVGTGVTLGGVTMGLGSDATGDIYYNNGGVLTRLPKGANGQALELVSGLPAWASVSGTGTVTSVTCFGTAITAAGTCVTAAAKADEQAGTSAILATTPSQQQQHDSAAKAWAYFSVSSGTYTLQASYNIASFTKTSTGSGTLTFTTPFASANYACFAGGSNSGSNIASTISTPSAASVAITHFEGSPAVATDPNQLSVVCFGRQ
jgi:hypothetical protein